MSFQEKSAWVMLVALFVPSFLFFYSVFSITSESGALPTPIVPALIGFTIVTVIIAVVGHIVVAVINPNEANAPKDERCKLINRKAGNLSSYVLVLGVISGLGLFLVIQDGNILFYVCFASLVLSQLFEYSLHIFFNRSVLS